MLFIHGDKDNLVPTWMAYELYKVKSDPKELWIAPNAAHDDCYRMYPEEYTNRVRVFTNQYIQ